MKRLLGISILFMAASSLAGQVFAGANDCLVTSSPGSVKERSYQPCSQDINRNIRMTLGTRLAGENIALDVLSTSQASLVARYTTTGNKSVSATPGEITGFLAASGTSVTVAVYDDPDGTCNTNQLLGTLTLTNGVFTQFPSKHTFGICVIVGGTSPDLSVLYRRVE